MNFLVQWLSYILMWLGGFVAQFFPADPFKDSITGFNEIQLVQDGMSYLNWFLPFNSLQSTIMLVIACIVSLYALKLAKWVITFIMDSLPVV